MPFKCNLQRYAMEVYSRVAQLVGPKREALAGAEASLAVGLCTLESS